MLWQRLNVAENFFKHGDRDHDATTEFNPELTDFHLWDACAHYQKLTGESPLLFQIYLGWFMLTNEAIFDIPPHLAKHLQKGSLYLKLGRATYFNDMLPLAMRS